MQCRAIAYRKSIAILQEEASRIRWLYSELEEAYHQDRDLKDIIDTMAEELGLDKQ